MNRRLGGTRRSVPKLRDRTYSKEPRAITYCNQTTNYTRANTNFASSLLFRLLLLQPVPRHRRRRQNTHPSGRPTSHISALQSRIYTNHYRIKYVNTGRRISHLERNARRRAEKNEIREFN